MLGIDTSALVAFELVVHPEHDRVVQLLRTEHDRGEEFALTVQILAEFLHIATDGRRFATPLSMATALQRMEWWASADNAVMLESEATVVPQFLDWMNAHRLGRKRILDTLLAATFKSHGVRRIVTLNPDDFRVFWEFEFVA